MTLGDLIPRRWERTEREPVFGYRANDGSWVQQWKVPARGWRWLKRNWFVRPM